MGAPIARVLQQFQNQTIVATEPSLKTVVVGPHVHVRTYEENRSTILSDKRIGESIPEKSTTDGSSPTIAVQTITEYPDNILGATPVKSSVKTFIEGYIEVNSVSDATGTYKQNTLTTTSNAFAEVAEFDRVVIKPQGVQVFEDLNENFLTAGIVPGTDVLKVGADIHNIDAILSEHRLLVNPVVSGDATLGFFAAADVSANVAYSIGDNSATFDNKVDNAGGGTGQRILWKKVTLFEDVNADFSGVIPGHFLKIGSDVHYIEAVRSTTSLVVRGGTALVSPQTKGEFAGADGTASLSYSIGTSSGLFKNVVDFSTGGTGQRISSDSEVRFVYRVTDTATIELTKFLPFSSGAGAPFLVRVEHLVNSLNIPSGSSGWEVASSVGTSNDDVTIAANSTITYLGSSRRITDASVYLQYQSLRQDKTAEIQKANPNSLDTDLGPDRKENPLRRGVGISVANAGTTSIYYLAVPTNDLTGHTQAINILSNDKDVYTVVLLSQDISIANAYNASHESLSTPDKAKRRILLTQPAALPTKKIVSLKKEDGDAESANVLFSVSSNFDADNIVPGDLVVLSNPTTNSYTVEEVLNGNRIRITGAGFTAPEQATALTFTVERTLTKQGQVEELKTVPASFNTRRVAAMWPDVVRIGSDENEPGYYAAAAVGGQIAALPSHRMTTDIALAGIDEIFNANTYFDDDQINELIDAGWYMFAQDSPSSLPYTLQQYTTLGVASPVDTRYLSNVKNFDFITKQFQKVVDVYPGQWNLIEELYDSVLDSLDAQASLLIADKRPQLGAPLLRISELRVQPSATQSDKIEAFMKLALPRVLNELDLYLIAG